MLHEQHGEHEQHEQHENTSCLNTDAKASALLEHELVRLQTWSSDRYYWSVDIVSWNGSLVVSAIHSNTHYMYVLLIILIKYCSNRICNQKVGTSILCCLLEIFNCPIILFIELISTLALLTTNINTD